MVLDVDDHADRDRIGVDGLLVDDDRAAEALLELGDPLLEQGLLVLRVVVLGVLGDVTELTGLLDALGDLAPARGRKLGDVGLKLFEAFLCDWYLASHVSPNLSLTQKTPDSRSSETSARVGQGGDYSDALGA